MIDITKLAEIVAQIRDVVVQPCYYVIAALDVMEEVPDTPAAKDVRDAMLEMASHIKANCRAYNNLRSRVATFEREQGVESPRFYEGDVQHPGDTPTPGCSCAMVLIRDNKKG